MEHFFRVFSACMVALAFVGVFAETDAAEQEIRNKTNIIWKIEGNGGELQINFVAGGLGSNIALAECWFNPGGGVTMLKNPDTGYRFYIEHGQVRHAPKAIWYSTRMLPLSNEVQNEIIAHEIAHLKVGCHHEHNQTWQNEMDRILRTHFNDQ